MLCIDSNEEALKARSKVINPSESGTSDTIRTACNVVVTLRRDKASSFESVVALNSAGPVAACALSVVLQPCYQGT